MVSTSFSKNGGPSESQNKISIGFLGARYGMASLYEGTSDIMPCPAAGTVPEGLQERFEPGGDHFALQGPGGSSGFLRLIGHRV